MAVYTWDPVSGAYILSADQTFGVVTNQSDYSPGQTVQITATFDPNSTVQLEVAHDVSAGADGLWGTADDVLSYDLTGTGLTWTATTDANGLLNASWLVNQDALGQAFVLTATELGADGTASGPVAMTFFTDSPPPPSEPTGFAYTATHIDLAANTNIEATTAGAIWANEGTTLNTSLTSSGTGRFGTFVEVQDNGAEQGYNTNANDSLDTKNSNNFNHPLELSNLQAVHSDGSVADTLGAETYYAFRLDLHQNTNRYISLDDLQIWQSTIKNPADFTAGSGDPGAQPSFTFNSGATQIYDLNSASNETGSHPNSVLLNSLFTSGSGGGADLVVLIPTADFNVANGNFVYLYSAFGYQGGGWQANSTFEEWGALLNSNSTQPPTPHASVSLEKDTVCPDGTDAGHSVATGTLLTDQSIEWTYAVTNTGAVGLQNVVVTDDNGTPLNTLDDFTATAVTVTFNNIQFNVGDTNHDGILNADDPTTPGNEAETWQFTALGTTVHGTYSNTATVTTDAIVADPTNPPDDLHPTGFGTSTYNGVTVAADSIQIVKYVSVDGKADDDPTKTWYDANTAATGPTLLGSAGVDPEYKFTITNTSDVQLTIHLNDSVLSGVDQDVTLAAGGTTDIFVTGTWAKDLQTNTADVSATFTDACDNQANPADSDVANYFGAAPAMTIEKDIICPDDKTVLSADKAVNLLKDLAGTVTYEIVVKNTGNVALVNPSVTDPTLGALGTPVETGGSGNHTDNILDVGETWTYTVTAAWVAGGPHVNTATATDSYTDSAGNVADATNTAALDVSDSASYFGLDPHITIDKKTNGVDHNLQLIQGQAITWTYDVKNDGNVDLTGLSVSDNPSQTITAVTSGGFNTGDTNHDGILSVGETWHYTATGTAGSTAYSNTATATTDSVSDACGDSVTPSNTDTSDYTGHAKGLDGLTKGYWATHLTLWDVVTSDSGGTDLNPPPQYDWNKSGGTTTDTVVTSGPSSGRGAASGPGDSGLLIGDLNHDGHVNDSQDMFFDLASAQTLANSSVSGDARIILGSQAVAAQLNEYNEYVTKGAPAAGFDASPTGLIEDAVRWLNGDTTYALCANGHSNVNATTSNDVAGITTIINDSAGSDYSLSGGALTFLKTPALSSSDASWSTKASTGFTYVSQVDGLSHTVYADGEGLKNALAAYNHGLTGTAGLSVSADGKEVYWVDGSGHISDVQANTNQAFWGILEDQNLLAHAQVITGVVHDSASASY